MPFSFANTYHHTSNIYLFLKIPEQKIGKKYSLLNVLVYTFVAILSERRIWDALKCFLRLIYIVLVDILIQVAESLVTIFSEKFFLSQNQKTWEK